MIGVILTLVSTLNSIISMITLVCTISLEQIDSLTSNSQHKCTMTKERALSDMNILDLDPDFSTLFDICHHKNF